MNRPHFPQTSFQTKLIIVMGLMLLPLVALAAGSLLLLENTNDALDAVTHEMTENFQPVTHLQTLVLKAMYAPHHYLIYGYLEERELFIRLSREVDKAFAEVIATSASAEKRGLVVSAQEEWWQVQTISEVILSISHPRMEPVTTQEMEHLHEHIDRVVDSLDQIHDLATREADERHEQAHGIAHRALLLTALIFVVGLAIAIIAAILLVRSVLIPVRLLKQGAEHFGKGDLSYRVPLVSRDELGELAKVFNDMAETLEKDQAALEELATHDGLTGLLNHREFQRQLQVEVERAQRYKRPISLLMIDIDHFKIFNDTYGHQSGDIILHTLADQMLQTVRAVDYVARYGGEEFTIVMQDLSSSATMVAAERLRSNVATHAIAVSEGRTVNITISIGVATFPEDADSKDKLIAAADKALYAAKAAGRNRVLRAV